MQQRIDMSQYAPLISAGTKRSYSKKRTVLFQGEAPRSVLLIESGIIKVYGITNSGDQRTITLLTPGDIFPMSWVFGKTPASMYYYEAVTDCNVYAIEKSEYEAILSQNNGVREAISKNYLGHYITATMHIYALEQSHAQDKLNYILQCLVARFGTKGPDGNHVIGLRLSHQDIAEMVGITRETTAVELHKLKAKGLIDYQKFTYSVNLEKLVRAMGSDEFENLSLS